MMLKAIKRNCIIAFFCRQDKPGELQFKQERFES